MELWAREDRKSNASRNPLFTFRATLTLYLMRLDAGDNRHKDIARTLHAQMTPETLAYLGLPRLAGDKRDWYGRYWRAMNRLLELAEPWRVDRKHKATPEAYQAAVATYSQTRRDRMDELMNMLLHASTRRLPADIRTTYAGNVAIDATLIEVVGEANPNSTNTHLARINLDATSGRYRRGGNHEGRGGRKGKAGYEMETVVTVPNRPNQPDSFPILTTGLALHQPGRTKHGARIAVGYHAKEFSERGYLMADRLYNWMKPHRFQQPIRELGFRAVWDYKVKNPGKQGAIDDVILVGGHEWYSLRAHVESNNQYAKADAATDLGNPEKRRVRGYAYQALTAALAFTAATLRRIVSLIEAQALKVLDRKTLSREARRRTDELGNRLAHHETS